MGEYVYILTEIANNNYPMYDSSTTISLILRGSVKMVAGLDAIISLVITEWSLLSYSFLSSRKKQLGI